MKRNQSSQSAFLVPRILLGFVFLLAGVSVALVGFGQSRLPTRRLPIASYQMATDSPDATPTPTPTPAMTFTVTSTADTDGSTCGSGCTLRQAVNASNANPPPAGTTNLINFNIAGAGVHTITLTNCLGSTGGFCLGLTQPAVIDGYSQPGASANTLTTGD